MRNSRGDTIGKILIVGGGPAGSSLAIRLANQNFDVTLADKDIFPRHKLCGEFISPECFSHFSSLGVSDEIFEAGGEKIAETRFFSNSGKNVSIPSAFFDPENRGALGLSRFRMDHILLERARSVGVEVIEDSTATGLEIEDDRVNGVHFRSSDARTFSVKADLIIDATGRTAVLERFHRRESGNSSKTGARKFVGFKAHFKNASIDRNVCEIYSFRDGYGGLNFVEDDLANHCFLVRAELAKEFGGDADRILHEAEFTNTGAKRALTNAERVTEWIAVAFDRFGAKNLSSAPCLISVGDSSAFIDPFTGSGMLMAFESAEILDSAITTGRRRFEEIFARYEELHSAAFRKRLLICSLIRHAAFSPTLAETAISVLRSSRIIRRYVSTATRSPKTIRKLNT
ncbi:MAG: NAD(P)/FAD-dependent oxidoreductase [Pyrinomonadaceae bacterium]|nr:NAD(P)/FAD-dependent oxidoreductase [Pyrinomonadaceae bacterium]